MNVSYTLLICIVNLILYQRRLYNANNLSTEVNKFAICVMIPDII